MALTAKSEERLATVKPALQRVMRTAIRAAHESGLNVQISAGLRTAAEQNALYKKGRTAASRYKGEGKVTNCDGYERRSRHQDGDAVDVYFLLPGGACDWSPAPFERFALMVKGAARQLGIPVTWGGSWKMKDLPHFELKQS